MSLRRAQPQEKYLILQRELLRKGTLYEDRDFPPTFRSLFTKTRPSVPLQWKRPKVSWTLRMRLGRYSEAQRLGKTRKWSIKARLKAKPRFQSYSFWNSEMAYSLENFRLPCN